MPKKFKQIAKLTVKHYQEANALLPKVKALLESLGLILAKDYRVYSIRGTQQLYMTVEVTEEAEETGASTMLLLMLDNEKEKMYDSIRR